MSQESFSRSPQSLSANSVRPLTRRRLRKAPAVLAVPDVDEDSAERKRVLNVLAQRRYRERKRQKASPNTGGDHSAQPATSALEEFHSPDLITTSLEKVSSGFAKRRDLAADIGQPIECRAISGEKLGNEWVAPDENNDMMLSGKQSTDLYSEIRNSFNVLGNNSSTVASRSSESRISNPASLTDALLTSSLSGLSSDRFLLPVNELAILQAATRIASRINAQSIFDINANSSYNQGIAPLGDQLPPTLQPTASQVLLPHHPVMDFLPWPDVRDKIINIMNLPDEARPPAARGPLGLVNFYYDLGDGAEGVRIWGSDLFNDKNWEVGQVFFERWWFIFDRNVIDQSNRWRRLRGAPPLQIKN